MEAYLSRSAKPETVARPSKQQVWPELCSFFEYPHLWHGSFEDEAIWPLKSLSQEAKNILGRPPQPKLNGEKREHQQQVQIFITVGWQESVRLSANATFGCVRKREYILAVITRPAAYETPREIFFPNIWNIEKLSIPCVSTSPGGFRSPQANQ
jgi:hypothetical protein